MPVTNEEAFKLSKVGKDREQEQRGKWEGELLTVAGMLTTQSFVAA